MNIIKSVTQTPDQHSTRVLEDRQDFWIIGCEGCGEPRKQPKRSYSMWTPVALGNTPQYVEVTLTAPEARRCTDCGPFPTN